MLVRCQSSSHSTNIPPNVIPLSVHNEDDETCRGYVSETRSMSSRSNGALRKIQKEIYIRIRIQPMFRQAIYFLTAIGFTSRETHISLVMYARPFPISISYFPSRIIKKYAAVLIVPREWLRGYSWREFYRVN